MYGSTSRVFLTLSLFIMVLYSNVSSIVSVPCLNSIIIFARRGCSLLCPSNSLMLFYAHESLEYHEQNSWAWTKSQKCTRQIYKRNHLERNEHPKEMITTYVIPEKNLSLQRSTFHFPVQLLQFTDSRVSNIKLSTTDLV